MRITRLPHLARETRRRHDRFLIIIVPFIHRLPVSPLPTVTVVPRRRRTLRPRRDAAAFNLQLARLALLLRRQHPAGSDGAVAGVVAVCVDVGL